VEAPTAWTVRDPLSPGARGLPITFIQAKESIMLNNAIARSRQLRKNNEGGFTLIELLIVITVLGILAAIVVFGVATFRNDATTAANNASCKTVSTAAEAWNAKNGSYPGTVGALQTANYIKTVPAGMTAATTIDGATGLAAGCTV
jgi:prepilin-type N-terminal cleavage/methylation domain-containing protein